MNKFLVRTCSTSSLPVKRPAEDQDDWRQPRKTFKFRPSPETRPHLATSNSFDALNIEDNDNVFAFGSKPARTIKITKAPPIFVNLKQDWTHEAFNGIISKYTSKYNLKYTGKERVAIFCDKVEDHQKLKEGLREENAFFHTYSRQDERPYKVIVRGLPPDMEDQIRDDLKVRGFNITSIKAIKTQKEYDSCPLYLVNLPCGTEITKFRQIKYLCHCVVQLHKFIPKNSNVTQCFRCQRFGHASRNCNYPARCVKCTDNHPTIDCPKKDRSSAATCCNCNEDHPANYSKCKERLIYLEGKIKARTKLPLPRPPGPLNTNQKSSNGKQIWAKIASAQLPHMPQNQPRQVFKSTDLSDSHLNINMDATTEEIINIISAVKSLKDKFVLCDSLMDKVLLILTYLGNYV